MTREDLAAQAGVCAATIYRAETGRVRPHRGTALLLAAALDVEPAAILNWQSPAEEPGSATTSSARRGRDVRV